MTIDLVSVRYIVGDVDAAVSVYTSHLGFAVGSTMAPAFFRRRAATRAVASFAEARRCCLSCSL